MLLLNISKTYSDSDCWETNLRVSPFKGDQHNAWLAQVAKEQHAIYFGYAFFRRFRPILRESYRVKCRPWAKNSSSNTNDLYIHYMDKSTGTPSYLQEKKALPNCGNKDGNIIHVLATVFWGVWDDCTIYPYVIDVWWRVFGSRSAFKVTPEVFSWD